MSFLANLRGAQTKSDADEPPRRVLLFGDSHVHAIQEAIRHRNNAGDPPSIEARRLLKTKSPAGEQELRAGPAESARLPWYSRLKVASNARRQDQWVQTEVVEASDRVTIGDTTLDEFLAIARSLRPIDVLVSVIGGNQHAVVSTIQHPERFDFILPGEEERPVDGSAQLIPFRSLYDYFASGIRQRDGKSLEALRAATTARIVHLQAPPPKSSNEFIKNYHDTQFATLGIADLGVSKPELRLKFWRLQNLALGELCGELDIELLAPPAGACDAKGFLARPFYARDATHANAAYGDLVIAQLEERFR